MKINPGRGVLWLMVLIPLWLGAEQTTYTWQVNATKSRVAEHEAFAIEYTCRFSTQAYPYVVAFEPPLQSDAYRMIPRSSDEQVVNGKRINRYRFVVFPQQPGELTLALQATMEYTTRDSIENAVIGRDNVEKLDYTAKKIDLPVVKVLVRPQPTAYAGHMRLWLDVDHDRVDAYTPVQVALRLEGEGNLDALQPFTLKLSDVHSFTDGESRKLELTDRGYEGTVTQQFALVSEKDFTIPSLQLRYYDTRLRRVVNLSTPPHLIHVLAATVKPSPEDVPPESQTLSVPWPVLLAAALVGFIAGRFVPTLRRREEDLSLLQKLHSCTDPKRFIVYLASMDTQKYAVLIDEIDALLAEGKKVDLRYYKRQLNP